MNNGNQTESSLEVVEVAGSRPLSKRAHETFAWERSLGTAITIAAERAGLSRRSGAGSKLEQDEAVKARIAYLAAQDREVLAAKRRRLEERHWLWHEVDIGQFYEIVDEPWIDGKGNVVIDQDGNPVMRKRERLRPLSELPLELRMCVESLTWTDSGKPNLKLYRKDDANRELRKINGIDAAPSIADGEDHARMSDKELFAELAKQASDLGVNLKMTFEAMVE